jgi:hypothetical protein
VHANPLFRTLALAALAVLTVRATAAPSDLKGEEIPELKAPNNLPEHPLKRQKGTIGTLITVHPETGTGGEVGKFVRITATALPGAPNTPDPLSYDKFLGPFTMKSLGTVLESVSTLHHGWPRGQKLQISFSERPAPVELNPATLADALLLDSMFRDWDIEQNFAAIGIIQPDGSIGAVEGIAERLTAAAQSRVARIVVPAKNYQQVADYLLAQGIQSFVGTQIFTAETFNEAGMASVAQLEGEVKEASILFGSAQRYLQASGAVSFLRDPRVQATLQKVLAGAPNHLSAKVLYEWGTGQHAVMSFDGSVAAIDRFAPELIRALRAKPELALATPRPAVVNNMANLKYVHERLDPRAKPYAEALLKFGDVLQKSAGTVPPPKRLTGANQKDFEAARLAGTAEWTKMAQARMAEPTEKPATEKQ